MRKILAILFLLAVAAGVAAENGAPVGMEAPVLDIRVSVRPVADDAYLLLPRPRPDSFRCSVVVLDVPGGKRGWVTEDIVIARGEKGEASSTLGPLSLHFAARIDRRGGAAETEVTIRRDGKIVNRQRTTVALRPRSISRSDQP